VAPKNGAPATRPWQRLIPDPLDCFESAERFRHRDLPALSELQLWAESVKLAKALADHAYNPRRDRLIVDDSFVPKRESVWLRARLAAIQTEMRRRKGRTQSRGGSMTAPRGSMPLPPPPAMDDAIAGQDGYTDAAFAERFAAAHRRDPRFHHRLKQWLRFGPHHFRPDRDGVKRLLIEFARAEQTRAHDIPDPKMRRRAMDAAMQYEQQPRIERALNLAQVLRPLADEGVGWDADPMLLGVRNGVVDLRTGRLRAGRPEDRIMLSTAVDFVSEAIAPRVELFIAQILGFDEALRGFVQCALGYSLTGSVAEQCVFVPYGTGSNGKTTLIEKSSVWLQHQT
jgi:D5 N terminal like